MKNNEIAVNYDLTRISTREIDESREAQLAGGDSNRRYGGVTPPRLRRRNCAVRNSGSATMPASDERVPGESDDEELPPAAGPSAPGPSFLDATDTTVIRIDDSPLVLPPSVDPDDDGPEPVVDERVPGESDDEVDDPRAEFDVSRIEGSSQVRHRRSDVLPLAVGAERVAQQHRDGHGPDSPP